MGNERYVNGNGIQRFDSMFPGVEFTATGTDAVGEGAYGPHTPYDPPV